MKWEDFVEAQKQAALPDQGKNSKPYFAPKVQNDGKAKVLVAEKPTDALGDKGTPELSNPKDCHPLGKKVDYSALKTESFLAETAGMNTAEFVEAMMVEGKKKDSDEEEELKNSGIPPMTCQYTGATVIPSAMEVARYAANMLGKNERARRTFIRELRKSEGGLGSLLGELSNHGELYSELVNQMGMPDNKVAKKLVSAMHDNHDLFMKDMGLMMNPMSESVDAPLSKRLGLDDDDVDGDDEMDMDDDDMDSPMGAGPDDMSDDDLGSSDDMGDGDMGDDTPDDDMMGDMDKKPNGLPGAATPQMKLNKEFAYHHMIKEMAKFDHMSNAMREILGG